MAVTDHYDFWYIDPDEEISDFPSTWNFNIDDIDAAIHAAATDPVAVSRVPNLPASQTTTGTFDDSRIPSTVARTSTTTALENRIGAVESRPRSTGVRNLASLLDESVSSGVVKVVRIGNTVTVSLDSIQFDGDGSYGYIVLLPNGFRAPMTIRENMINATHGHQIATYTSGSVQCNRKSEYTVRSSFTYVTLDDWPSTLPGDPD